MSHETLETTLEQRKILRLQRANEQLELLIETRTRELYQANLALEETRARAERLLEQANAVLTHAPTALATLDRGFRVQLLNEGFRALLPSVAEGDDLRAVLPGLEALERSSGSGAVRGPEEVLQIGEIERVVVPSLARLPGEAGSILVALDDRTELVRAEEVNQTLSSAQDAAIEASRQKSSFLANMSHELRTPLGAMLGYAEMMIEALQEGSWDKEEMLADLERLRASGSHLLALVNDLLDMSRIEAGRTDLVFERVDLRAMLEELAADMAALARTRGNEIRIRVQEECGQLLLDRTRIRQILVNLVGNALKFTEAGVVSLEVRRDADRLMIVVEDTGAGMSEAQLAMLFRPFEQTDASIQRRFGGTGLGLVISRQLVRAMGGEVAVSSAPGRGSRFEITLPGRVVGLGVEGFERATSREAPER